MSDLINGLGKYTNNNATTKGSGNANQASSNPTNTTTSSPPSSDNLQLTSEARALEAVQLASPPEINSEKIDAIKQAISNGEYPVDAEKIAQNLIDLESALSN